jgi:hypothetical protein
LARLIDLDPVPETLRDHLGGAGFDSYAALRADTLVGAAVLDDQVEAPRHELEQLVSLGVHLAAVWRGALER